MDIGLNHWAAMLEQDPDIAQKRIQLTAQSEALTAAFEELCQCTGNDIQFGSEMDIEEAM
jgi:hypothetical protein